jgi:DNA polymerase-3 subunit alpha
MKITKIVEGLAPKLVDGTLPDIDTDFAGRDRGAVKAYIEERFGQTQVCSVGTFTTMKLKGLVKDLARTASVDFSEANLMTAIIDEKDDNMLDLIKRASLEPKLKTFIKQHSELFYMIPSLINQPKTQSIHPCAVIIFPNVMSSNEWCPTRLQQGLIVSEWGGGEMDSAGFLKEDILGIRQLDKFQDILSLIEKNGQPLPDIYNLPHDPEVYRYFSNGWNGDVFQLGSTGLTEYTKSLKPQAIGDLIAAVAIFRPGPMENHYHEIYVKCKNEGRKPQYLWGTEDITKDTYGLLVYQEQIMQVCQQVGGLSMKEADDVRRAMGKQKLKDLLKWKDKVQEGFLEKGCELSAFEEIWNAMLEFAKYSFNKSHSAAYALTGYVGQYLKVNYPIEYWTVALNYADENKSLTFLSEILQTKKIKIKSPDINKSEISMSSDQSSSTIFWGLGSIKGIGEDTALQIVKERKTNGVYKSFADFLSRHTFKNSKVKKQTYEALISAGSFDILYGLEGQEERRNFLINRFRKFRKVKVTNPTRDIYTVGETSQKWWWCLQQKKLTGLAFIDYREIAEDNDIGTTFCTIGEFNHRQDRGLVRAFGGYIVEAKIGRSKKGEYARLTVEHNYKLFKIMVWSDEYADFKNIIKGSEKKLIVFDGELRFDAKWSNANQFTIKPHSKLIIL